VVTSSVRFLPGAGTAIVGGWFAALVDAVADVPLVEGLDRLATRESGSIDDVIEVLIAHRLRDLPPFTICCRSQDQTQLLARGSLVATLGGAPLHGAGLRTWFEHSVAGQVDVEMSMDGQPAGVSPRLWVARGLVEASYVEWPAPTGAVDRSPDALEVVTVVEAEPVQRAVTEADEPSLDDEADETPTPEPAPVSEAASPSEATTFEVPDLVGEEAAAASGSSPYDHLFHATQHRSIEGAAVRPTLERRGAQGSEKIIEGVPGVRADDDSGDPPVEQRDGDHDGHTRSLSSLKLPTGQVVGSAGHGGIPASRCSEGHLNPPNSTACRVCSAAVLAGVETVDRPIVGVLVLPTGERIGVDRTTVVGRSPRVTGSYQGDPPRLVTLGDNHDLSRTHVVIEVDEWTATVTDRDSRNGTVLHLPGVEPELLRGGLPAVMVPGSEVVLAECVTLRFESA